MIVEKFISLLSRLFFLGAFVLFGLAVFERVAFAAGYTILFMGPLTGGRLLEISVVLLVFVIAMQLREMKGELRKKSP
jgi:hypothetical protein